MLDELPFEVLILVTAWLDVPCILSLRQTSTIFNRVTRERVPWLSKLREQQYDRHLPFPAQVRKVSSIPNISTSDIEKTCVLADRVDRSWLLPRSQEQRKLPQSFGRTIINLEVYLERWLLVVYSNGMVALWDMSSSGLEPRQTDTTPGFDSHSAGTLYVQWSVTTRDIHSSVSALDVDDRSILLVCTSNEGPHCETVVLRIDICTTIRDKVSRIGGVNFATVNTLHAMDPALKLVIFSRGLIVTVFNWETDARATICVENEELEQAWNGIITLGLVFPWVLCARACSIDLHPIPEIVLAESQRHTPSPPTLQAILHYSTFRSARLSSVHTSLSQESNVVSLIAYDLRQGLFLYQIQIPSLETAMNMAKSDLRITLVGFCNFGTPFSSPGTSRGFVSAICLGPEGKRGVWAERDRGSTRRNVVAFDASSFPLISGEDKTLDIPMVDGLPLVVSADKRMVPVLAGQSIYNVGSYDLRDDLLVCAFSEVRGWIALGSRSGEVIILDPFRPRSA